MASARRSRPPAPRWAAAERAGPKSAEAVARLAAPEIQGRLTRRRIPRTNDYQQAGERHLLSEQWERDDLVANLTTLPNEHVAVAEEPELAPAS